MKHGCRDRRWHLGRRLERRYRLNHRRHAIGYKGNGETSMSAQKNVQIVKDFFAAMGGRDRQVLLTLCADDIEWIIPGEDWPLAGTYCGPPTWKALKIGRDKV